MEKLQRPSGPGLGGALCVQCRWKLDWELKLGLNCGRAEKEGGGKTAEGQRVGRGLLGECWEPQGLFRGPCGGSSCWDWPGSWGPGA